MTAFEVPLLGPAGEPVDLARTLASHGFATLAPLGLDEAARTLEVTIRPVRGRPRRARIGPGRRGRARIEVLGPGPGPRVARGRRAGDPARAPARAGPVRLLRPRRRRPRALVGRDRRRPDAPQPHGVRGRREDVCTTNCAWSATVRMVNALVSELGEPAIGGDGPLTHAFPTPLAMADAPESFYREMVRAGYRGAYLSAAGVAWSPAGSWTSRRSRRHPPRRFRTRSSRHALLALPGVGPYAAAHIMMTIGRNSPADPRQLDASDVRAPPRPDEAGPRRDDPTAVPRGTASTRGSRSGCSSPATGSTERVAPHRERGHTASGPPARPRPKRATR